MRPLQSSPLWGHCVKATIHARSRQAICSASAHRYISTHLPGKPSAGQALHYRPSTHKSHSRSVLCIGSLHGMTRGCGPGRAAWIPEYRHRTCLPAMVGKQVDVEQPCRCACLLQLRCQAKPVRLDPSLGALTLLQAPATQPSRPTCVNQSSAAVSASASDHPAGGLAFSSARRQDRTRASSSASLKGRALLSSWVPVAAGWVSKTKGHRCSTTCICMHMTRRCI